MLEVADSDLFKTALPQLSAASNLNTSVLFALPGAALSAEGTNSAAFGFKEDCLVADTPFMDEFIFCCKIETGENGAHGKPPCMKIIMTQSLLRK